MEDIPVHFAAHVEALFVRALGPRLDAQTREGLKAFGLDLSKPLQAAYAQEATDRATVYAVERCFKGVEAEAAFLQLGLLHIEGFVQTFVGKALMQLGSVLGAERSLLRANRSARTMNNFVEAKMERVGPGHMVLLVEHVAAFQDRIVDVPGLLVAPLLSGVELGTMRAMGLQNPRATYRVLDARTKKIEHVLRWDVD